MLYSLYFVLLSCFLTASKTPEQFEYRWVYVTGNLQVNENVGRVIDIMKRAKNAGYNGIVLADFKLSILDRVPKQYFENIEKVKQTAKQLALDIYPTIFSIGYSEGLLSHDPNLVEGLPVYDATFEVREGYAELAKEEQPLPKNLDFEDATGDRFAGWEFQDDIGLSTFADSRIVHHGARSLRMENIGKVNPHGNSRVHQLVEVKPWKQYHVSVWIKTENFDRAGNARIAVLTREGKPLDFTSLRVQPTQDWKEHHVVFNSRDNTSVRLYFGVWGGRNGKIWWDDARMEQVGLLNVIRREGCPLTVRSVNGMEYVEGKDFERVIDERMGTVPWLGAYEVYHEPPRLRLTPNSRIKPGERLKVSFYHAITVYQGQVCICLSEPKTYSLLQQELSNVKNLLAPKGYFMSHDEIRVANWCKTCISRKLSPGQILADNVKRCIEVIRSASPNAKVFVWSDMFDPYHNARGDYYLVNGSWEGSWLGLPKEVIIVNWNFGESKKSLPFFASLGNKQILAGYYDGEVESIKKWLEDAASVSGVVGVMYTTWQGDYSKLEAFARAAWGTVGEAP